MMKPTPLVHTPRPRRRALGWSVTTAAIGLLLLCEPALANKFETIGGGVSGSRQLKLDWLAGFLYAVGGLSLLGTVLAVLMRNSNTLFLNVRNWKASASVLAVITVLSLGGALLI